MCKSEGREFRGEKVTARLAILYQCLQRSYLPYANGISPIPAPASNLLRPLRNSIEQTGFPEVQFNSLMDARSICKAI